MTKVSRKDPLRQPFSAKDMETFKKKVQAAQNKLAEKAFKTGYSANDLNNLIAQVQKKIGNNRK